MNLLYSMGELMVDTYMTHPNLKKLMGSGEKFDICLFENFNTEALFVSIEVISLKLNSRHADILILT